MIIEQLPHPSNKNNSTSPISKILSRVQHNLLKRYELIEEKGIPQIQQEVVDSISDNKIEIWGPYIDKCYLAHSFITPR